jgi:hypothetical protein
MKASLWNVLIATALFSFTSVGHALPVSQGYAKCSCVCSSGSNEHSEVQVAAPNGDVTACSKLQGVKCSDISKQQGSTLKSCDGYISSTPFKIPSDVAVPRDHRPDVVVPR